MSWGFVMLHFTFFSRSLGCADGGGEEWGGEGGVWGGRGEGRSGGVIGGAEEGRWREEGMGRGESEGRGGVEVERGGRRGGVEVEGGAWGWREDVREGKKRRGADGIFGELLPATVVMPKSRMNYFFNSTVISRARDSERKERTELKIRSNL